MSTRVEEFHFIEKRWEKRGLIFPGDASFIDQKLPDDERVIYSVHCDGDNAGTVVYRIEAPHVVDAIDILKNPETPFSVVNVQQPGDRPFILTFRGGYDEPRRLLKFTHV